MNGSSRFNARSSTFDINHLDLVIFDCDGVIVDSETVSARVDVRVLGSLGWDTSIQEVARLYLGRTQKEFHQDVSQRLRLPESWHERFGALYEDAFATELAAVAGAVELIDTLKIQYCIASNSAAQSVQQKLELCGLSDHFVDRIFSAEMVAQPKPAPDIHRAIMRHYGLPPDRCMVVEDSSRGIEAAVAAGAFAVALRTDLVDESQLSGADLIIDSLCELRELLEERPV